ncbi:hypothetical protein [Curtobacterium luteum]|nr:hypothetical protein [Curtobacterium luteum]
MAASAALVVSASLASCSTTHQPSRSTLGRSEVLELATWRASMDRVLASEPENDSAAGIGSGGGSLSAEPGDADVVAACNGALHVRFEISVNGSSRKSIDVQCGATATVRLMVPENGTLDVSIPDERSVLDAGQDGRTFWYIVASQR